MFNHEKPSNLIYKNSYLIIIAKKTTNPTPDHYDGNGETKKNVLTSNTSNPWKKKQKKNYIKKQKSEEGNQKILLYIEKKNEGGNQKIFTLKFEKRNMLL